MIRFTKAKATPAKPKKPKGGKKATLNKLKSFLAQAEPEAVEILVSNWKAQQNAITYKELREAYLAGGITQKQFEKWQKDYSKLITSTLAPKWEAAATAAAQEVKDKYPYFLYEPSVSAGMDFIKQHGAELVTNLAQEQRQALNAVIQHVSGYTAVTPDEAARIMRPCIGLTKPQALANARYQEKIKNSIYEAHRRAHPHGSAEKAAQIAERKAREAAARYAARQHRYRAQNIARTELAYAYNAGAYGATKDAQAQGYIGDCVKVWLTAYDERVCPICSALDDEKRNMDEAFSNGKLLPPGHPQCRCAVAYEEIDNTNLTPAAASDTMDTQGQAPQQGAEPAQPPAPEKEPEAAPAPQSGMQDDGVHRISGVLDDLSVLPETEHGMAIRSDSTMVENLNLSGRRVTINGTDYYEITGKLTEETWAAAAQNAKSRGMSRDFEFLLRGEDGSYSFNDTSFKVPGYKMMTTSQASFEVYSDYEGKNLYGMGGYFRVRVPATGNPAKDRKAMEEMLDKAGLKALTADPTDADELLMRKARIAWQRNPSGMEALRGAPASQRQAEIDRILKNAGITDSRVMAMQLKEVAPGYSVYIDSAATAEYRKAGLTHVWAGVNQPDFVVEITKNGGFMSTVNRATSGLQVIGQKGASELDDVRTGGACNVFTRIGVNTGTEYRRNYKGGRYRILIDPQEMSRTDWYAYQSDSYGDCRDSRRFSARPDPVSFIKENARSYNVDNEIMFRNGISSDKFIGISCQSDDDRARLLFSFRDAGITEVNGVPVDDFVKVTQKIGEDSLRGTMGLDFYEDEIPF